MNALSVRIRDVRVGVLELLDDSGMEIHRFSFEPSWIEATRRPVLGQQFEDSAPNPISCHGAIPFFAHLLPQGPLLRAVARASGLDSDDVFGLLGYLGADLPGAVVVAPGTPRVSMGGNRVDPGNGIAAPDHAPYRFSLAGVQWKMSLRGSERLTVPLAGEEAQYIGKWPSASFADLPRREWATMQWASASGLETPRVDLVSSERVPLWENAPPGTSEVLLVERFDRSATGRIHIEDFAQVFGVATGDRIYVARSSEHVAAFLAATCPDDVEAFVRRIVFCLVSGNGDAHLKNWSLIYRDGRTPELSPAYDMVPTILYPSLPRELALSLDGRRAFTDIDRGAFARLAHSCRLSTEVVDGWVQSQITATMDALASVEGFSPDERSVLQQHHAALRLIAGD
jgi:serine/threonine-protein kinase HipA